MEYKRKKKIDAQAGHTKVGARSNVHEGYIAYADRRKKGRTDEIIGLSRNSECPALCEVAAARLVEWERDECWPARVMQESPLPSLPPPPLAALSLRSPRRKAKSVGFNTMPNVHHFAHAFLFVIEICPPPPPPPLLVFSF